MRLIPVIIKGKVHRLSERALELLNLEPAVIEEKPIIMKKLPPNLEILKIQKSEPKVEVTEVKAVEKPVEVKKNVDVTAESTEETKPKKRRRRGKVGTEE